LIPARLTLIGILLFSIPGFAIPKAGHNLSATSKTLKHRQTSVGTYTIAHGLTDTMTLATSPWLAIAYNMPMVLLRNRFPIHHGSLEAIAIDVAYFKTVGNKTDLLFIQESLFLRGITTLNVSSFWDTHINLGYQYFFDYTRPYSLKPDSFLLGPNSSEGPHTLSFSSLNDFAITKKVGVNIELGILGLNYTLPFWHLGGSAYYNTNNWYFQAGYSYSWRTYHYRKEQLYHPELQLQYIF